MMFFSVVLKSYQISTKINLFCLWIEFQLHDIIQCKGIVDHFAKKERLFAIIQSKWTLIEEAVRVLKMFFLMTKELQRIDFTLSDFYGYLIAVRENLQNYLNNIPQTSTLATCLQTELNKRLPMLNKNPVMLCAVFLDRRYSSELNKDEKALAIRTLLKIWDEMRELHKNDNSVGNDMNDSFQFADNASVLEAYFNSKGVGLMVPANSKDGKPNYSLSNADMYENLQNFDEKFGRQPTTKNVLEFWKEQKIVYPEIYSLSTVINAIPPTQATTERCFSSLNFIFDEKRTKLSMVLLEQILLIRLNVDIVLEIFKEDLEIIKNKKT